MEFRTWQGRSLATAGAALALFAAPAAAQSRAAVEAMRAEMEAMAARIDELERKLDEADAEMRDTLENRVAREGSKPGTFRLPGSETEIEIGGYIKTDFIFDADESTGDLFVPEAISVGEDDDEKRFRAHARQSRLFLKTATPTEWGALTTWLEGDFFGGGGNEVFSNSFDFRLRHAVASVGGLTVGQTWSNFMPIESYPATVDFNGPAGIPFIRQAQIRYTMPFGENLTFSGSLENSELSARDETGEPISESTNLGIRAGVDVAPDVTAAATWRDDWGLVKLAGVGRLLGAPDGGDDEFGYGLNLSGNANLWEGGKLMGSFTYGDGVGRYLINGFGQDAFLDASGEFDTIEAFGFTAAIRQEVTEEIALGLAYGRSQFEDSVRDDDLEAVDTVHVSLFWTPIERLGFGAEAIWGRRENSGGESDDAIRLQSAVQVNF